MTKLRIVLAFISFSIMFNVPSLGAAQENLPPQEAFTSENAILNTALPFTIGAREAQQSLRGSFGWPTFQEGLVLNVYFRFDPDGYARFSPTPRLDSDVFEVVCRPRTYSCMARKGSLSLILNSRNQLQMKIDGVTQGDKFFVSEGVSEIQIPDRILQPLDTQLETLLSTQGDLVVRRGDNTVDNISLTGFYAVTAYLRWIAARQDYSVLPRGWPVPNSLSNSDSAGLTQAGNWQSPMPQPQAIPLGGTTQTGSLLPSDLTAQTEVAEVRGELKVLRELLLQKGSDQNSPQETNVLSPTTLNNSQILQPSGAVENRIAELQRAAQQIQLDLQSLQPHVGLIQGTTSTSGNVISMPSTLPRFDTALQQPQQTQQPVGAQFEQPASQTEASKTAKRLEYLMSEIGLDAKTAVMLVQLGRDQTGLAVLQPGNDALVGTQTVQPQQTTLTTAPIYQDDVVAKILMELEAELAGGNAGANGQLQNANGAKADASLVQQFNGGNSQEMAPMAPSEYKLLSEYFRSVIASEQ